MTRSLLAIVLVALGAGPAYAGTSYPIAATHVAGAVLAAHPELAGDRIELAARVEAQTVTPALVAGPVERWPASPAVARIRLRCQGERVCLPFYALVHLSANEAAPGPRPSSDVISSQPQFNVGIPGGSARNDGASVLRTGQRASMLIDSGVLHLRIPVTCLQGGAVGSTIRVAGPGRTKVFEAAVLDGTTVRGSL